MRLTCSKEDLAAVLSVVGRAASSKNTVPVLGNMLVEAKDGQVTVAATDMEISLRAPLTATIEEAGAVVLPRLATDIVRSMSSGPVVIEHRPGEGIVSLSSGASAFTLNCHQASEFPELPPDTGEGIRLPAATIVAATERVVRF